MSFNLKYPVWSDEFPTTAEGSAESFQIHKAHLVHPVKITENRYSYVVTWKESGLDGDTMSTSVSGRILTVKAGIKDKAGSMQGTVPGSLFVKNFSIPDNVNIQRLKTTFRDGVIRLRLPKKGTVIN